MARILGMTLYFLPVLLDVRQHHDAAVKSLTGANPGAEQTDLAEDPKYADKLAEMEALLLEEMRRQDDPYRLWDQPDDGLQPPNPREGAKEKVKNKK